MSTFLTEIQVEKFHPKLKDKIVLLYEELIEDQVIKEMEKEYLTSSNGLAEILKKTHDEINHLDYVIEQEQKVLRGGSKNKKQRRKKIGAQNGKRLSTPSQKIRRS
jgi:hypothetical protein